MELTVELDLPEDEKLINYLEKMVRLYNRMYRRVFQDITTGIYWEFEDEYKYTSFIHKSYGVMSRTANSVVRTARSRIKTLIALKQTQLEELEYKIESEAEYLVGLEKDLAGLKEKARRNEISQKELNKLRNLKRNIHLKKCRLESLRQKRNKWAKEIRTGEVKMTHGSRKLFSKQFHLDLTEFDDRSQWEETHDWALNHNMLFLGRNDEVCGNQIVQVYPEEDGTFRLSLRKDYPFCSTRKMERIEVGGLKLKYQTELFRYFLGLKKGDKDKRAIAYRFLKRKNGKWYLQIIFETDKLPTVTSLNNGLIAIDFNDAFLALAEVKRDGNLIGTRRIELKHHAQGGRALAEIRDIAKNLAVEAAQRGMPIAIEDLSFKKTKAQTKKGHKSEYNRMVHSLDYSRFREAMERACERNLVDLIAVPAANTSKIGQEKYSKPKHLDRHYAAAYVIGRRAMGFKDRKNKKKKKVPKIK